MTDTNNTRSDALAWIAGSDAPEKSALNLGFMALTDSASLIVAATQGFAQPYGLTLNLQRQASWAGLRDRLLSGELDATQMLYGQVYGIDQGLGGYRLLWERGPGGETVRARVAELVGLSLPGDADGERGDWMVGVIRWIRIDDEGRVDAGVELLARRALPVGLRTLDDSRRPPVRGVLLAPLDGGTLNPRPGIDYDALLASTEIDRGVRELELTAPPDLVGPPMPARSERLGNLRVLEATGIYQHFGLAQH